MAMELVITGRQMNVTPSIKKHIEERAQKIVKFGLKSPQVTLTLKVEKYRHIVEAHVNVNGFVLQAEEETDDMHASVDKAMAKIEQQLRKYKEKVSNHRVHLAAEGEKKRATPLTTLTLPVRAGQKKTASVVLGNREGGAPGGLMPEKMVMDLLTVEEALLQMKSNKKAFFLFKNRSNRRLNLLYKKKTGVIGLIEPTD